MKSILDYYMEVTDTKDIKSADGAQLINGKWYIPQFGCDTIQLFMDDLASNGAMDKRRILLDTQAEG
jgi:hypothetical protein